MKAKDISKVSEAIGVATAFIGTEESLKVTEGVILPKTLEDFVSDYLNQNSRQKKIADVLRVVFKTMLSGSVNPQYIRNQGLDFKQLTRVCHILENCQYVEVKTIKSASKTYTTYTLNNKFDEEECFESKYNKNSTKVKFMEIIANKFGIDNITIGKMDFDTGLDVAMNRVWKFAINADFYKYFVKDKFQDKDSLIEMLKWEGLSSESHTSALEWLNNAHNINDFTHTAKDSHRTYDALKQMPKAFKRNLFRGYMEYDMRAAHLSLLLTVCKDILEFNPEFEDVNWQDVSLKLFDICDVIYSDLQKVIEKLPDAKNLCKMIDVETYRDLAKEMLLRYIYETGEGNKLTILFSTIVRKYLEEKCPELTRMVDYIKGISRKAKKSIFHLHLTKLEQELIVEIQCQLAEAGIITYNEHDGIFVPPFESDLQKNDFDTIVSEVVSKFKEKHFGADSVDLILKRKY